ncbi:MAG: 50S ribosome-binding GTPase [Bacteroidales bacterium]|nr:50S ribosome-binding GTPase [Candidatus Equimonas faecalis]
MHSNDILKRIASQIETNPDLADEDKIQLLKNIRHLSEERMNILVTGGTGCGKSSTINALFNADRAKVGTGASPETQRVARYELDNLVIWDTPGFGDGKVEDENHKRNIIRKLHEPDPKNPNRLLIDLVLVIIDGSTRDLGTAFDLINNVIIPNLGEKKEERILIAINQADAAMKGYGWDRQNHKPTPELTKFLEEKVEDVKNRIFKSTGVKVDPIYYSAGFTDPGGKQETSYNISKLLYYIIEKSPAEKRLVIGSQANAYRMKTSTQNDDERNYREAAEREVEESTTSSILGTALSGASIGYKFGGPIGGVIGGVVGGAIGFFKSACYITTATCRANALPDDCYELQTLRNYRDTWLVNQPDGPYLINRYYDTAPQIVDKIDQRPDSESVYKMIKAEYIDPCVSLIEQHNYETCKQKYMEMVNALSKM